MHVEHAYSKYGHGETRVCEWKDGILSLKSLLQSSCSGIPTKSYLDSHHRITTVFQYFVHIKSRSRISIVVEF